MILHVTFIDGSNSYVSLPTDRRTVAKLWRRFVKANPATACPMATSWGTWEVVPDVVLGGYRLDNWEWGIHKHYERLGNALAALERRSNSER